MLFTSVPNPGSTLEESRRTLNWVVCEPCGDGRDGCARPKQPVFKVTCGEPPPVFDSALVLDSPRPVGPPTD